MRRALRRFVVILVAFTLAVCSLPGGRASAAITWEDTGRADAGLLGISLEAGQGLNLATNEPGEDLVLTGTKVTSVGGLMVVEGATAINSRLTPPESGYVTSIDAAKVENKVVLVRLADGGWAQIQFGMGWRGGSGFSSLMIEEWYLARSTASVPATGNGPGSGSGSSSGAGTGPGIGAGSSVRPGSSTGGTTGAAPVGRPGSVTVLPERIPAGVTFDAAVSTGQTIYLFARDQVYRFDPRTEKLSREPVVLPEWADLAAWDGKHIYLLTFEGTSDAGILQYDPATGRVKTMGPRIPYAIFGSAFSDGRYVYFAGLEVSGVHDEDWIAQYDPATDTVEYVVSTLPDNGAPGAAWDGKYAYLFGGGDGAIRRYDPTAGSLGAVQTLQSSFPVGTGYMSGVYDGRHVYFFGGSDGWSWEEPIGSAIFRFDPKADTLTRLDSHLPSARGHTVAAWAGGAAYIFGGTPEGAGEPLAEIVRFVPPAADGQPAQGGQGPQGNITPCSFGGSGLGLVKELQLSVDPIRLVVTNDCHAWVYSDHERLLSRVRLSDGQVVAQTETSVAFRAGMAYSPVTNLVYLLRTDEQVEVFDGTTGAAVTTLSLPRSVWYDINSPAGIVADPASGRVFVYDADEIWAIEAHGSVKGPVAIGGPDGNVSLSGAVVRSNKLWLFSQPWLDSPAYAVPVDPASLTPGSPVILAEAGTLNYALGASFEVHPTNGSFYLSGQRTGGAPFVAVIKGGKVERELALSRFTGTPALALSPDGEYLVARDGGMSGTVVTDREYTPTEVIETHQLFSVFGSVVIARTSDFSTLASQGGEISQPVGGWFVSEAGKPSAAAYSPDGQYLFITDTVQDTVEVYRVRTQPLPTSQPGTQAGGRPGSQPGAGTQPGNQSGAQPGAGTRPGAQPGSQPGAGQAAQGAVHFQAVYLTDVNYRYNAFVYAELRQPDFHLTLNPDGTAQVIQTVTTAIGQDAYPVNMEYLGTYTKDPFTVTLRLQPAIKGYETLYHDRDDAQVMEVTGDLAPDMSRIDNLVINGRAAKSGSATRVESVPKPGRAD